MKILLINPNSESETRYAGVETQPLPLGLAYIAAVLENDGYDVEIIDGLAFGLKGR
jgi:hypothetical protein